MLTPELTREQLRKWRRSNLFFCPQCDFPVHLKVGEIIIPHFAHKKDASCSTRFSEGESKEHLLGKQQLYIFLQQHAKNVVLEPFLHMLSQRPDLLVTTNYESIPIEFQCSKIAISDIESRSAGYRSTGMKPIWILHTPAKFSELPLGVGMFYFSRFHETFFTHTPSQGHVFLTYYPQTERFHYFSSLIHVAGKRYIGIHRSLSLMKQVFPFAQPKKPSLEEVNQYVAIYLAMRNDFLQSRILLNRRGVNDPFLKMCYELRVLPTNLPPWIGLPVPYSDSFREHDCEWQLSLIYFMRWKGASFRGLTHQHIVEFVSRIDSQSSQQVKACMAYRDLLISAGVDSLQNDSVIDEENIFNLFSERFLAK